MTSFPWPIFLFLILMLICSQIPSEKGLNDPNLVKLPYENGKMSTLEYRGHKYIAWSLGGLVHDPSCECQNAK